MTTPKHHTKKFGSIPRETADTNDNMQILKRECEIGLLKVDENFIRHGIGRKDIPIKKVWLSK